MATYEGPICPSFEDVLSSIKSDETNMAEYRDDLDSKITADEALKSESILFTDEALGSIPAMVIPRALRTLYQKLFYSMLSPTFTDPKVFDPINNEKTYMSALGEAGIDPEEAALKAGKIAFMQAVAIYQSITSSESS
jgi:hypothetical protein